MRKQEGQTLLEILLAFGVAILVLSAVIGVVITSLSNTQYTKNQNLANFYAKEGMAVVRGIRDSGWPGFYSKGDVDYCLPQNVVTLASFDGLDCIRDGNVGIFVRRVKLIRDSPDCAVTPAVTPDVTPAISPSSTKVTVIVSWSDNKCLVGNQYCHKVELITCFSNLDQKQEP